MALFEVSIFLKPISQSLAFEILIWSISMVADYFILSMSDSTKLSELSEDPAAMIVIPLRIVTTNSVLRLVVKNVFRFVS